MIKKVLCWALIFCVGMGVAVAEDVFSMSVKITPAPTAQADDFSLEVVSVQNSASSQAPRIYIYHTHTYEAYNMEDGNKYKQTEKWRTADNLYNVVRVGEELAKLLEEAGFEVYHDRTAYEPPRLSSAYSRSLEALEKTLDDPYDLYIDLHRDSYSKGNGPNIVTQSSVEYARLLILVGKGTGQTASDQKPDWQQNEKIGNYLTKTLNNQIEDLCRGVSLKSGRYNQHIAPCCILIEAGNNQNTLTQALNTMQPLSLAICAYFDSLN